MIDRYNYQNAVVEYCQKQRPNYLELTAFNRLKQSVHKTKMLNNAIAVVNERKYYWDLKINFTAWHKKYSIIKKNYTTYAFIAVQIKRKITENCFESLKTFALYKKNKRIADLYNERTLKQKLLNTMYNVRITSDKNYEASHKIITSQNTKTKRESIRAWFALYKEVSTQRIKVENHLKTKEIFLTKSILQKWKKYSSVKARVTKISSALKSKTDLSKISRGYCTFKTGVLKLKQIQADNRKAVLFYNTKKIKAIKSAWVDQALHNREVTQKVVRVRNMRNRKMISSCWEIMLQKTDFIRAKIRCVKSVTKIPSRIEYRLAFQKWSGFLAEERALEKKTKEAIKHFSERRLSTALVKLIEDHRYKVQRKKREEEIDCFYFAKQAKNIFAMFREFLEIQREKRDKLSNAIRYRKDKLLYKGLSSWQQYMKDNYELFIKRRAMLKRLKERNCPIAFKKWSLFTEKHRIYRDKSDKAMDVLNTHLKRKSIE